MALTTMSALIFLLYSQIQNTGALPVRHNFANYLHEASGNGKQGPFVKEIVSAKISNENSPCQIFPVTDDPLIGINTTPIPASKPGQDTHQTVPPLAPSVNNPEHNTYQTLPPPPPKVFYQPIVPYYILPPNPQGGGSYVYGQGADNAKLIQGGGPLLPHSPFGASDFLQPPRWFLDLLRDKAASFPQRSSNSNPTGNQRGSLLAERFDSTSSEMSSEEDSDGD